MEVALKERDADFRIRHVGASEVSALFGVNPWLTEFELFHRKRGTIATPDFNAVRADGTPENNRIFWGVALETAIFEGVREKYGYIDREDTGPASNGNGLGGHPDRRVICPERGPGIVEVKMVDWLEFRKWNGEPPIHYQVQSNTYAGLDKVLWHDIITLVGGNDDKRFCLDFRPKLFAEAERRVKAFWQSVHENRPPKPDYSRDVGALKEVYADQDDETLDLAGDNRAAIAAAEYLAAAEEVKLAQGRKDAAQAELIDKLKTASVGFADGFTIRSTLVKAIADREAKEGEIIKGRKAYRRLTIKELAE